MPELMHDWLLLWGCVLLRKLGYIGDEPDITGCVTVLAGVVGIYYWLSVIVAAAEIVNDVFFFFLALPSA